MTADDFRRPPAQIPGLAPSWHWAAWVTRVGTVLTTSRLARCPMTSCCRWAGRRRPSAYRSSQCGRRRRSLPDHHAETDRTAPPARHPRQRAIRTDPGKNVFQCETGEITIDAPQDRMTLDTPRTAGGFAPAGRQHPHGATASRSRCRTPMPRSGSAPGRSADRRQPAAAGHALDGPAEHATSATPNARGRRCSIGAGCRTWSAPAEPRSACDSADPEAYQVWALGTDGKRLADVPATVADQVVTFTADVAGFADHGAVLSYEIVRKAGGGKK